jgi:hypothetical protein
MLDARVVHNLAEDPASEEAGYSNTPPYRIWCSPGLQTRGFLRLSRIAFPKGIIYGLRFPKWSRARARR